jgi:cytochrome b561
MNSPVNPPDRYDPVSIVLHWVVAVLILVLFLVGWYMVDLPKGSPERTNFFTLHKSIGLTVAALVAVRLAWRWRNPLLAPPVDLAPWQRRLATAVHRALYVFMVLQPLSGYLSSSYSGYATRIWGLTLPQWAEKDPVRNEFFTGVHELSSLFLFALIVVHLCGAFAHVVGRHANVLPRMWPRSERHRNAD